MSRPLAALTGATGFLGSHLVRALDAAGWRVRVLARRPPSAPPWAPAPADVVPGALEDPAALARLVVGADVVIHAAGLIKASSREAFFEANQRGAGRVAEAALAEAAAPRVLLVSSISAREPGLSHYAASKAAGEDEMRRILGPGRLTIARPPAVYGPGDRETLAVFRAALSLPVLPVPGPAHARLALIHAEDAAAQIAALAGPEPAGAVFTLSDGRPEGYAWREIMAAAARALGRAPPMVPLPGAAIVAAAALNALVGRLGGAAPMLTPGKARELLHPDWSVRPGERAPGAPPARFGLEAGFAHTLDWYRAQGWL